MLGLGLLLVDVRWYIGGTVAAGRCLGGPAGCLSAVRLSNASRVLVVARVGAEEAPPVGVVLGVTLTAVAAAGRLAVPVGRAVAVIVLLMLGGDLRDRRCLLLLLVLVLLTTSKETESRSAALA